MSESLNNKELIAVGHEFAKAMTSDTPIIDIAKMMSRLAERLDCTTAALRETVKQRDALSADNVARAEIIGQLVWQYSASGIKPVQKSLNPASALLFDAMEVLRQPATAAAVNELKAQGVELAITEHLSVDTIASTGAIKYVLTGFAQQLRAGEVNHD
ncbi:hypothetical protein EV102420_36_00080 [Pseudescherichia vulneris NBRC 102420]|uniref:Uncharacterized protein n=1 Tax=Pseudescherichia vulneris NBRC 102420 TaxID=1115515 RepID=A0A090V842_PSEVU|nr:hypothetical protein [Pseudescherichia vulneris]GAL60333.1 hypothetical protein EV102420_36_00080 [Pseudescherichia vulneris NBRC 102420]STQ59718.1 Uncharacterised protein [Pseudescherichia vulneris]